MLRIIRHGRMQCQSVFSQLIPIDRYAYCEWNQLERRVLLGICNRNSRIGYTCDQRSFQCGRLLNHRTGDAFRYARRAWNGKSDHHLQKLLRGPAQCHVRCERPGCCQLQPFSIHAHVGSIRQYRNFNCERQRSKRRQHGQIQHQGKHPGHHRRTQPHIHFLDCCGAGFRSRLLAPESESNGQCWTNDRSLQSDARGCGFVVQRECSPRLFGIALARAMSVQPALSNHAHFR